MPRKFVTKEFKTREPEELAVEKVVKFEKKEPKIEPEKEPEINPAEVAAIALRRSLDNLMEGADELRLRNPHIHNVRQNIIDNVNTIKTLFGLEV